MALQSSLTQSRAELDAANLEINEATAQFNEMARQIELLNQQLAQQQQASDEARVQLDSARLEIAELSASSSQQQQTISQLSADKAQLSQDKAQLSQDKAQLSQDITAYNQQLLTLKGEYETVKSQYEELIKPARSAKGKHIAQVYYVKDDSGIVIRYRQPGDSGFSRLSLAEVEKRLDRLKREQGENLYVKIIIPGRQWPDLQRSLGVHAQTAGQVRLLLPGLRLLVPRRALASFFETRQATIKSSLLGSRNKRGLSPMVLTKAKTTMHPEFDYGRMNGTIFRECLGGFAACGLLREKLSHSSAFSRPERMSWV